MINSTDTNGPNIPRSLTVDGNSRDHIRSLGVLEGDLQRLFVQHGRLIGRAKSTTRIGDRVDFGYSEVYRLGDNTIARVTSLDRDYRDGRCETATLKVEFHGNPVPDVNNEVQRLYDALDN